MPVSDAGHPAVRRFVALLLLLAGVLLGLLAPARAQSASQVDVLEIDGVLDQTVAGYLRDTVEQANADGSDLIVVDVDTPGGLNVSAAELIEVITASEVPVLTFVPTSGQASSAGTVVAYASHVLAMSPVSRMGAAAPVDLADPRASQEDVADQLTALAAARDRNVGFAAAAATDDQVLTVLAPGAEAGDVDPGAVPEAGDLLALTPEEAVDGGYVDLVEPTLSATLDRLSGYEVSVEGADGVAETVVLDIDGETANVRFHNPGLVSQLLHTVANPTLAYLLLIAGALAIAFEVFQPGFGVAGLSGLLMTGLGVYGLGVLPVSWLAFALVVVGLVLLAVDLALAGLGLLTAAGTAALAVGSFLLFTGPPVLRVSPWVIGPVVVFAVVFFVGIMTTVLRAQGNQALTGAEAVIGQTGVVRSMLNPEGHIFVRGALWRARAPESAGRVRTGTQVRVVGLNDQLTLDVELVDADTSTPVG